MQIRELEIIQTFRVCETPSVLEESIGQGARSAEAVAKIMAHMGSLAREQMYAVLLDGKHHVQAIHRVSEGTLTSSLCHPREVFCVAVRELAAAIILVHNHPSGDPEPSAEDLEVTRRMKKAGTLLGIPLLDHVVIGRDGRFVSLRERMF